MSQITVFSQPGCGPCVSVKLHLRKAGVSFVERDVTVDPEAAAVVRELGYQGTPVVTAGDMHTHGYRREWLDAVVEGIRREESDPGAHVESELAAVEQVAA